MGEQHSLLRDKELILLLGGTRPDAINIFLSISERRRAESGVGWLEPRRLHVTSLSFRSLICKMGIMWGSMGIICKMGDSFS